MRTASTLPPPSDRPAGEEPGADNEPWTGSFFERLPFAGTQIRATRALRDAGEAGAGLGLDLMPLLEEIVPDPTKEATPTLARITRGARTQQPALTKATADLNLLSAALQAIPEGRLVGPIDSARRTARRVGPPASTSSRQATPPTA